MSSVTRIALLRHGETDGESSVRYHGVTDVALSRAGEDQVRATARRWGDLHFDLVVSSPLRRARACAPIAAPGRAVRLEEDFREIHFGRWEGLTAAEIEARDPVLYREWREAPERFGFPGGEARADFRARVERGLGRLLALEVRSILVLAHKGVVRALAERLTGDPLPDAVPELAEVVHVARGPDGRWAPRPQLPVPLPQPVAAPPGF